MSTPTIEGPENYYFTLVSSQTTQVYSGLENLDNQILQ
jgi:hypothetical protein